MRRQRVGKVEMNEGGREEGVGKGIGRKEEGVSTEGGQPGLSGSSEIGYDKAVD